MAFKPEYPALLSVPRFTTLLASLFVSLSSGSNYVYSAYAPQLGSRLQITHTQLSIIGLAGNIGVLSSGLLWGRIVDLHGPRPLLASAFVLLFIGYTGIRYIFDTGLPVTSTAIPTSAFCALVLCNFMTGAGGSAGVSSAINSTAKTFPEKARATATGFVLSGFGLSALLFSTIARVVFSDNTSSFLLLLSLGTSIPMIAGWYFVRTIPLPPPEITEEGNGRPRDEETSALLAGSEGVPEYVVSRNSVLPQLPRQDALNQGLPPNVHGYMLWIGSDFWLLFVIFALLGGTGLMYINNVGSMSRALYIKSVDVYNPIDAAHWQADQVSSISLLNFFGRILIGLVSDYTKNRFGSPRSYSLVLASTFFFISQIMAALIVDDVRHLWMVSAMLGLAYGSTLSAVMTTCMEWFGMPHFSENSTYVCLSPIIAGNLFSVVFGRNLDAHDNPSVSIRVTATTLLSATNTCSLGRGCYADALYMTMGACLLSVILSVWAGWRDRRMLQRQ